MSHYRILEGNPFEGPSRDLPTAPSANQCGSWSLLFSEPNEQLAQNLGVKHVILPKRGYRSKARLKHEHKAWFMKGRHWHAGIEGRRRCLVHGRQGFHSWVGWGVIAGNLAVPGRT